MSETLPSPAAPRGRARRWAIRALAALLAMLLLGWFALGYAGAYLATRGGSTVIADLEAIAGHPLEEVRVTARDGVGIAGWYVPAGGDRAVVTASGIGGNRMQHARRAEFYLERGWSIFLVDLRSTGRSDPAVVTMGWKERKDLLAAKAYLREAGYAHIGAHGISLGAATIAYSLQDDPDYAFLIMESCYDTMDTAWRNRLAMVGVPHFATLPLRWFAELRMGVRVRELEPVRHMGQCRAPVLFFAGDSEPELPLHDTMALYEACAAPEKRLVLFEGGRHENFLRRFEAPYREAWTDFMAFVETRIAEEQHEVARASSP